MRVNALHRDVLRLRTYSSTVSELAAVTKVMLMALYAGKHMRNTCRRSVIQLAFNQGEEFFYLFGTPDLGVLTTSICDNGNKHWPSL